ncbi:hypothetical protein HK414_27475 [Ramlibacter terrae]|uniref:Virulence factor MviN n=1 Tax=Ramlibacter terrae TaxID=2732511 RepID=A0ABX6P673_9BURK|nr:hypothetical protein HK414_27475 [Ramlibacter terrae]
MGAVAVFTAVASLARLGQDAAIAWRFGTGPAVDAYYFLLNLASWPVTVALSLLSLLIAPTEARLRASDADAARRFRGELLAWACVLALILGPAAWWVMHAVAGSKLAGFGPPAAAQAAAGAMWLAPMVSVGIVGALLSAWLVAAGRHVLALLEGLPPLVLLLLVLLVPGPVLFWGTSAGFAVQAPAMAWILRRAGELPGPRLGLHSEHWKGFSEAALLLLGAQALFALFPLIDSFFAARMEQGTVAALSYTNRLVLGLQGLAGLALQRSGLPLLSKLAVHSPDATRHAAHRWALAMGIVGTLLALVVAAAADLLVALVFERGSFNAADRAQCVTLLRYGMLQMPFFPAGTALVSALAATGARHALALVAVTNPAVKLAASAALVPLLGAPALMVATALMYAAATAVAWLALRRRLSAA